MKQEELKGGSIMKFSIFKPKSVIRVYGKLVFVPSILVASLAKS